MSDCKGCEDCFGCVNLRRKRFHVFNEPVSAEAYRDFLNSARTGSHRVLAEWKCKFAAFSHSFPRLYAHLERCEDTAGDNVRGSKGCVQVFDGDALGQSVEECRCLSLFAGGARNCWDMVGMGDNAEESYCSGPQAFTGRRFLFCGNVHHGSDLIYCDLCSQCSDCIGCIGLTHKRYCILNQQYGKEDYEAAAALLLTGCISRGEWGEYFPAALSPFAYNESSAQEFFPLEAAQAEERRYRWYTAPRPPAAVAGIPAEHLPDAIADVPDDVVRQTILCEISGRPFRLIKDELAFYRRFQLPLPRRHPQIRLRQRLTAFVRWRLVERSCAECGMTVASAYEPARAGAVLCSRCYENKYV